MTHLRTSPEVEVIARAVVCHDLPGSELRLPAEPLPDDLWRGLARRMSRERLTGQAWAAVVQGDLPVTPEQHEQLRARHTAAMAHALRVEQLLVSILRVTDALEVPIRALKGVAVSHLDYEDPSRRGVGDLDLLTPPQHVPAVQIALEQMGFRRLEPPARPAFDARFGKSSTYVDERGAEVDLHRTFVMGPFGLSVDLDELWAQPGDSFELGGTTVAALGAEARLLHACFVAVLGDVPPRIAAHRDLAEMTLFGRADPERTIRLARTWGAEALLATALLEAWEALHIADETALTTWATRYSISSRDERLLALYRRPDAPYSSLALHSIPRIKGMRDRAAFVWSLAMPDEEFLRNRGTSLPRYLMRGAGRALTGGRR